MLGYYGAFDVVVCGGGTSGIAAAISASRAGAKTILIERVGQLGGQMNFSGPPGFSYAHLFNARQEQVIAGIVEETHARLLKAGHALPHQHQDFRGQYTFSYVDPEWWGLLIYEMMEENNVELMLHSQVTDVIKMGETMKGVVVAHPSGSSVVLGKIIIDCTGEGDVSYWSGCDYEILDKEDLEPSTVAFTVDGVDWEKTLDYIKNNIDDFLFDQLLDPYTEMPVETIKEKVLACENIIDIGEVMGFKTLHKKALESGDWHENSGMGFFLMPKEGGKVLAHFQHSSHVGYRDATDVRDMTAIEVEGRQQDVIAWRGIKKYIPGFENAYIVRVCPEARVRETRRIMGEYKLTVDDVRYSRKFDDVIGKSSFPANSKHVVGDKALDNVKVAKPLDGGSFDIPYRCLVPLKVENLIVAGKPISTERNAHRRFLQETMVTGQAAGVAAALCARDGKSPRELMSDVSDLQKILQEQGAVLYGTH